MNNNFPTNDASFPAEFTAQNVSAGFLQELNTANERYRLASDISSEVILDYTVRDDSIYHVSNRASILYGIPQLLHHAPEQLISCGAVLPESAPEFLDLFHRIRSGEPQVNCIVKSKTIAGEYRWNQVMFTTLFDESNLPYRAVGLLKDITPQRLAELQCEIDVQHRNAIKKDSLLYYEADLTHQKMLFGLEGLLRARNLPYTDCYADALLLLTDAMIYSEDREMVRQAFAADALLAKHAEGHNRVELEYRRMGDRQTPFWVRGTAYLTVDPQSDTVLLYYYVNDINDEKIKQLKYQEQAQRDLLTGVYNKGTLEILIQERLTARPAGKLAAFLIIDLDDFKSVNDQMGHAYGDALLSEVAHKLLALQGEADLLGRIGGDEFALFFANPADEAEVRDKAQRICQLFHMDAASNLRVCKVTGTVGIALLPKHGDTFEALYRNADLALYEGKRQGKDTYAMYSEALLVQPEYSGSPRAAIDHNEGKRFSENITEYVMRILYESQDLQRAICGIMEMIARHFHFSRSYLFRLDSPGQYSCVYEWCNSGVAPLPEQLRSYTDGSPDTLPQHFAADGIYCQASESPLAPDEQVVPILAGVYLRVQSAMTCCGAYQGFLGFDRERPGPTLSANDREALQGVAHILDLFLSEAHSKTQLSECSILLQAVADSLHSCTYLIDPETHRLQFVNRSTRQLLSDATTGSLCYETIRNRTAPCPDCPIFHMLCSHVQETQGDLFLDRYQLWARYSASIIRLPNGKEYGLFNGFDFTQERQEPALTEIAADGFTRDTTLYNALCRSTDDYIFMCDMTRDLFYFPQAMVAEFGLPGQIIENAVSLWASYIHESDRDAFLLDMDNMLTGKSSFHNQEYRARTKSGNWQWLRCRGHLERDTAGNPTLFAGIITVLGKKTKIDPITGMPNKYEFEMRAREMLTETPGEGAVLLLGLDNFKHINKLYGWEYGDDVLRESAQQLQAALPLQTDLYRLDGDKFGVFFPSSDKTTVERFFTQVFSSFQHQHTSGQYKYFCTVSGGYAITDATAPLSFPTLLKQAEYALEYAKSAGKSRLSAYDDNLMHDRGRALHLIEQLQASVEQDFRKFYLHYQPQVDAKTHRVLGAEALLRWSCVPYGNVRPDEFIPLLEQTGLIHKVGLWVIRQASQICRLWRQARPDFIVNVNVSAVQFQDKNFIGHLSALVNSGEVNPSALHLELTESCISAKDDFLITTFTALRNMGFSIEMDDFGTGYSSLAVLKNAPADVVKIDRAFVQDITHSEFDVTFIRFVVDLCHAAGIQVCLEGVETNEEYSIVSPIGLDFIQGYLFGHPQRPEDFETFFLKDPQ